MCIPFSDWLSFLCLLTPKGSAPPNKDTAPGGLFLTGEDAGWFSDWSGTVEEEVTIGSTGGSLGSCFWVGGLSFGAKRSSSSSPPNKGSREEQH